MHSGIADCFERIEIVSEKNPDTYRQVVASMGVSPGEFCMVGNSLRSDVLPALEMGAHAVHVPYHVTWAHEQAEPGVLVATLDTIGHLPAWLTAEG